MAKSKKTESGLVRCIVLSPLKNGGKIYKPAEIVELPEESLQYLEGIVTIIPQETSEPNSGINPPEEPKDLEPLTGDESGKDSI